MFASCIAICIYRSHSTPSQAQVSHQRSVKRNVSVDWSRGTSEDALFCTDGSDLLCTSTYKEIGYEPARADWKKLAAIPRYASELIVSRVDDLV